MKARKRWLSLVLVIVLLIACLPVQVLAEETTGPEEKIVTAEKIMAFEEMAAITEYDEGYIEFTTFEDLQQLASRTYSEWTGAYYTGTDPLVIKSSLTLPENLAVYTFDAQLKVPANVTLTAQDILGPNELVVEGTLECEYVSAYKALTVTGSVICHENVGLGEETVVSGSDKITFTEEWGLILRNFSVTDTAALKAAIAKANAESGSRWYNGIYVSANAFVLNESVELPESCELRILAPFTIQQGCTLEANGDVAVFDTLKVNGTLINNSFIYIFPDEGPDEGGKLEIAGGSYAGEGFMCVSGLEPTSFDAAISGLNLSEFEITEDQDDLGYYWVLDYIGTQPQPQPQPDPPAEGVTSIYRLYNPYTLEHLFTSGAAERDSLASIGWDYEGVAWNAPTSGTPVHRLYNPYSDGHFYTVSQAEVDSLLPLGWKYDGVVSYGASKEDGVPIYRLFNPYEAKNYHHYTISMEECEFLVSLGWKLEGVAWYGAE